MDNILNIVRYFLYSILVIAIMYRYIMYCIKLNAIDFKKGGLELIFLCILSGMFFKPEMFKEVGLKFVEVLPNIATLISNIVLLAINMVNELLGGFK